MPGPIFQGNCNYTPISTIGTQTINPGSPEIVGGQPLPQGQTYGVLYGFTLTSAGTAATVVTYLDIYVTLSTAGTTTVTNTLLSGTASAAGNNVGVSGSYGIRYRGALVLVTSGTAGAGNSLWD